MLRKGPEASATAFPVGKIAKGNDGNKWIVKETTTGIRRWVPLSHGKMDENSMNKAKGPSKSFYTLHDGYYPFMITKQSGQVVDVHKRNDETEEYTKLVRRYDRVLKIILGKDASRKVNTVVLQITVDRFVYVGADIYEFRCESGDVGFSMVMFSDISGSSPDPVLVGKVNAYFLLEMKYMSDMSCLNSCLERK
jgi:hypothetical protein